MILGTSAPDATWPAPGNETFEIDPTGSRRSLDEYSGAIKTKQVRRTKANTNHTVLGIDRSGTRGVRPPHALNAKFKSIGAIPGGNFGWEAVRVFVDSDNLTTPASSGCDQW